MYLQKVSTNTMGSERAESNLVQSSVEKCTLYQLPRVKSLLNICKLVDYAIQNFNFTCPNTTFPTITFSTMCLERDALYHTISGKWLWRHGLQIETGIWIPWRHNNTKWKITLRPFEQKQNKIAKHEKQMIEKSSYA